MSNTIKVWLGLAAFYSIFWFWYVGFSHQLTPTEAEGFLEKLKLSGRDINEQRFREIIDNDDGKSLVVVNLISINTPKDVQFKKLSEYSKPFMTALLKRGGHPVFFAKMSNPAIEYWGLAPGAETWDLAVAVRYRSRRDLLEMATWSEFPQLHPFKKQAIQKTIAIPASPWTTLGGIPFSLALILVIIGLIATRKQRH